MELPEEIVARFRHLALEKLERIESGWFNVIQKPSASTGEQIRRDLHTIKGDARAVGFEQVEFLCHKLEELFACSESRAHRVPEDFDLVMTMGVRFAAMLVRRKPGKALGGIDLGGFVKQVDEVIEDAMTAPTAVAPEKSAELARGLVATPERLSEATRGRMAEAATEVFLSSVALRSGSEAARLDRAWRALVGELRTLGATTLDRVLGRHDHSVRALAADLGKRVDVVFDLPPEPVPAGLVEALDEAVLHAIRNAVDHGIEKPDERQQIGKDARGKLIVKGRLSGNQLELTISDDGRGIDEARLRQRASERGLLDVQPMSRSDVLDLVFHSGMSTAQSVSEISGRGVGLDAARNSLAQVGGSIHIADTGEQGTTLSLLLPFHSGRMDAVVVPLGACELRMAVATDWDVSYSDGSDDGNIIDVAELLGLPAATTNGVLAARRGRLSYAFRCAGQPERSEVERLCPTPNDYPIEIIAIGHDTGLLMRPDILGRMANV